MKHTLIKDDGSTIVTHFLGENEYQFIRHWNQDTRRYSIQLPNGEKIDNLPEATDMDRIEFTYIRRDLWRNPVDVDSNYWDVDEYRQALEYITENKNRMDFFCYYLGNSTYYTAYCRLCSVIKSRSLDDLIESPDDVKKEFVKSYQYLCQIK